MGYDVSFHPISPKKCRNGILCLLHGYSRARRKRYDPLQRICSEIWSGTKRFWKTWCDGQLAVLKKALTAAAELGVGLLEATEVVEPNPIAPNESTSYSNLYHCDRDGVYLYIDMAIRQIAQAMGKNTDDR